jgi:hypothetical protein
MVPGLSPQQVLINDPAVLQEPGLIESLSQVSLAGLRPLGSVGGNGFLLCQNPLLPMSLPT